MLKSILNLEGVTSLSKQQLKSVNGADGRCLECLMAGLDPSVDGCGGCPSPNVH